MARLPIGASPSELVLETIPVALELICRKVGMTQIFNESGECVPVTVLEAGPNSILQRKTDEADGYTALQIGYGERRASRTSKAAAGHFQKAGVAPRQTIRESRLTAEEAAAYEIGQAIDTAIFAEGQRVDVIGTSKGRGTAGVVKRHNFVIKRRTHGTHEGHRHPGSVGAGSYPGRVIKGKKMPGRMGNARTTAINQEIVKIDSDRSLLFIRGAVPGHINAIVSVRPSVKARV
jgi:large subunit ribosomal protein L3